MFLAEEWSRDSQWRRGRAAVVHEWDNGTMERDRWDKMWECGVEGRSRSATAALPAASMLSSGTRAAADSRQARQVDRAGRLPCLGLVGVGEFSRASGKEGHEKNGPAVRPSVSLASGGEPARLCSVVADRASDWMEGGPQCLLPRPN